jgi:hypothetical protein
MLTYGRQLHPCQWNTIKIPKNDNVEEKNLLQMDSITCFSGNERELISGLDICITGISSDS